MIRPSLLICLSDTLRTFILVKCRYAILSKIQRVAKQMKSFYKQKFLYVVLIPGVNHIDIVGIFDRIVGTLILISMREELRVNISLTYFF